MISAPLKTTGCVSISLLVLLAALLYRRHSEEILNERLNQVLSGLLRAEKKVPTAPKRVALGFGGCEDVFVEAMDIFQRLNLTPPASPRHYDSVKNGQELAELLAFFFQHGAAAERYVANKTLFEEIVKSAESSPKHRWHLGGNAPAMVLRLAKEGLDVMLSARLTQDIVDSLPKEVKVVGQTLQKTDIHVLMEYEKDTVWGQYIAPRANRLIVHSDEVNPYLQSLEEFSENLNRFKPHLVVVGGLQMMDNFPFKKGERWARLQILQSTLKDLPLSTKVHFEMASFTDIDLLKEILETVIFYSDSLGMNEQELPNLVSLLETGNVTVIADSNPRVATVLDQMRTVYAYLKQTVETGGKRKLTRLHIHTLAFQAILTSKASSWKNTMSAAAKAALTAHRHVCGSDYIDLMKTKILMDESFSSSRDEKSRRIYFIDERPVNCWEEDDYIICVAPGLVCTHVKQTGGGGDNISAAGLVLQL